MKRVHTRQLHYLPVLDWREVLVVIDLGKSSS